MLSDEQRRRLEQEKNSFEQSYKLQSEKIAILQNALVIETDHHVNFNTNSRFKKKIIELKKLDARLKEIEEQLKSSPSLQSGTKQSQVVKMSTNPKQFLRLRVIGAIGAVGTIAATVTAIINIPTIGCWLGSKKTECGTPNPDETLKTVELLVLSENAEPLPNVSVEVKAIGAPETGSTDIRGYIKLKIPSQGDVDVFLKEKNYPTQKVSLNLLTNPSTTREINLSHNGTPIVSDSISPPSSTSSPATIPTSTSTPTFTPTPTPTPTPLSLWDDPKIWNIKPLQKAIDVSVNWELKSCIRQQKDVSCFFLLKSSKDIEGQYGINWYTGTNMGNSRLVDSQSKEYSPSTIEVFQHGSAGVNDAQMKFNVTQDTPYKVIVNFTDVTSSVSINLLQIDTLGTGAYGNRLQFRNIHIN